MSGHWPRAGSEMLPCGSCGHLHWANWPVSCCPYPPSRRRAYMAVSKRYWERRRAPRQPNCCASRGDAPSSASTWTRIRFRRKRISTRSMRSPSPRAATGQETVACIHFRGHVNRHLRALRSAEVMPRGTQLVDTTGSGGRRVQLAISLRLGPVAIGSDGRSSRRPCSCVP